MYQSREQTDQSGCRSLDTNLTCATLSLSETCPASTFFFGKRIPILHHHLLRFSEIESHTPFPHRGSQERIASGSCLDIASPEPRTEIQYRRRWSLSADIFAIRGPATVAFGMLGCMQWECTTPIEPRRWNDKTSRELETGYASLVWFWRCISRKSNNNHDTAANTFPTSLPLYSHHFFSLFIPGNIFGIAYFSHTFLKIDRQISHPHTWIWLYPIFATLEE